MNRAHWLADQIRSNNYKIGVELGVLRGPTFKFIVENCRNTNHIGVDVFLNDKIWKAKDISTTEELCEQPPVEWYGELIKFCEGFDGRAKLIRDFTHLAHNQFEDGSLDYVFVDASHDGDSVKRDIELWTPKIRKGGLVSGHDINLIQVAMAVVQSTPKHELGPDNVWRYVK